MTEKNEKTIQLTAKDYVVLPDSVEEFRSLIRKDFDSGIKLLNRTYRTLEENHFNFDAFIRNVAGGASEGITWPLYNAVGEVYPALTRSQKDLAISATLSIMDKITYTIVNGYEGVGHTTGIREPLYLGEISTARGLYWPGLDEGKRLIVSYNGDFSKIRAELMTMDGMFRQDKVHSDFLVAYAFLRTDFSGFGEQFAEALDKGFLDRTLTAIVKKRFYDLKMAGEDPQRGLDRLKVILPESLHNRIEPIREKAGWVDSSRFP